MRIRYSISASPAVFLSALSETLGVWSCPKLDGAAIPLVGTEGVDVVPLTLKGLSTGAAGVTGAWALISAAGAGDAEGLGEKRFDV